MENLSLSKLFFINKRVVLVSKISILILQFGLFYEEMSYLIKNTTIEEILKLYYKVRYKHVQ